MLLLVVDSEYYQVECLRSEFQLEQLAHRLIDVRAVVMYLSEARTR